MEDLTLDKLKMFMPVMKSKEKARANLRPKRKKNKRYLVYREDLNMDRPMPQQKREQMRPGPAGGAEAQRIKPSNKSDKLNDKKKQLSFEKFKSDVDKHDRKFESGSDFLASVRESNLRKKEVPMFINMYDPFRNNIGIIKEYLKVQRESAQSPEGGLETIQERESSLSSSKSGVHQSRARRS